MKDWLKKISKKEIINLLESQTEKEKLLSLPEHLDKNMKSYIHSKKESQMPKVFPKQLKFLLAAVTLIIVAVPLYFIYHSITDTDIADTGQVGNAVVSFYFGTAEIKPEESGEWQLIEIGYEITENSMIRTGSDSELEIVYPDNSIIRIKENTELTFTTLILSEEENKL